MKRWVVGGLTVAAAVLALTVFLGRNGAPEVRLTGIVSANEALVASELAGRILELRANQGDRVSKGEVVAVLATEEIDAQIQSKRDAVEQTTSRLEQARERIRLETERVESEIDEAMAKLRAMEKEQAVVRAELDQARTELVRSKEIFRQGLLPRQQLDRQDAAVKVIEAKLKSAEGQVEKARANLEKERAGERQVRVMQQGLQETAAQAAQARYELERITVRLGGRTELRSPVTGMVSAHKVREGELVEAGAPVLTIIDPSDVWVRVEVEEVLVKRLAVGQPMRVILASDREVDGKVTFISPEAQIKTQRDADGVNRDIRTFEIKVALLNAKDGMHPGMTASVVVPDGPAGLETPLPTVPLASGTPKETPLEKDPKPGPEATPPAVGSAALPAREEPPAISKPVADGPTDDTKQADGTPSTPSRPTSRQTRADAPPRSAPDPGPQSPSILEPAEPTPQGQEESARPTPSVAELLENIDLENPTEEELQQLEASMLQEAAQDQEIPQVETRPPEQTTAAEAAVVNPPQFQLEGISVAGGRPVAVINGARVFEGDTVDGARVILIMGSMVQLASEGRTITLRF